MTDGHLIPMDAATAHAHHAGPWRWIDVWHEAATVPLSTYALAIAVEVLAVAVVRAVVLAAPTFSVVGSLPLLAVLLVAVRWGGAPAMVATAAGSGLLATFLVPAGS